MMRSRIASKLSQEPQIVGPELPDIVNRIHQHGDALGPHAESEATKTVGIVAPVSQYDGMHHAGTHDLEPTTALAQAAAFSGADNAVHIHFNARLRKRKITGADAHAPIFTEHALGKRDDGTFEVGHGDAPPDRQSFYLMEHDLATSGDSLIAVTH